MSIQVMDGFELYNGSVTDNVRANLSNFWSGSPSTDTWTLRTGRYAGFAIEPVYVSGEQIYKDFTALTDGQDFYVFFNFYLNSSGSATDILALPFHTDGTGIKILASGTIAVLSGETDFSSTTYVMSVTGISQDVWHTFQGKFTRHGTVAQLQQIWIDGVVETGESVLANVSRFGIDTGQQSQHIYLDDLVVVEDDSTNFSSLPHEDTRISLAVPVADGTREEFGLSTGSDSYALVDEVPADDDTTYLTSSTGGQRSTFDVTTITPPSGLQVEAVKMLDRAKNTEVVTQFTCQQHMHDGSSDFTVGTSDTPGTSYRDKIEFYEVNPTDSSRWTTTDFNNMEFGILNSSAAPV